MYSKQNPRSKNSKWRSSPDTNDEASSLEVDELNDNADDDPNYYFSIPPLKQQKDTLYNYFHRFLSF